jgi:hypothetical protein
MEQLLMAEATSVPGQQALHALANGNTSISIVYQYSFRN